MEPIPITEDTQLFKDLMTLDGLYEELLWKPDDELEFSIEFVKVEGRVVISNKTQR